MRAVKASHSHTHEFISVHRRMCECWILATLPLLQSKQRNGGTEWMLSSVRGSTTTAQTVQGQLRLNVVLDKKKYYTMLLITAEIHVQKDKVPVTRQVCCRSPAVHRLPLLWPALRVTGGAGVYSQVLDKQASTLTFTPGIRIMRNAAGSWSGWRKTSQTIGVFPSLLEKCKTSILQ